MLVLRYFFEELRYQKVTVHTQGNNTPSIRLHERLGFRLEGCLRRMAYTQGQFHDELVYGLTIEEFRALREERSQGKKSEAGKS
jgi:RimJ/RimL family protein N-acetyltransferase